MEIPNIISMLITENTNDIRDYFAAVACVESDDGRWLLGLSTATDDRNGLWCFPGGGIDGTERPEAAAFRECREEMGIYCRPRGPIIVMPEKPGVAFVYCRATSDQVIKHNHEFKKAGFFSEEELKRLPTYDNIKHLLYIIK